MSPNPARQRHPGTRDSETAGRMLTPTSIRFSSKGSDRR